MQVLIGSPRIKQTVRPDVVYSGLRTQAYEVGTNDLKVDSLESDFVAGRHIETITYTTKRKNNRAKSNMCVHNRYSFNYSGGTGPFVMTYTTPNPDWTYQYQHHHRAACDARDSIVGDAKIKLGGNFGSAFLGANAQSYVNNAFQQLRPDLTKVDVPNFLLELDDVRSLAKIWRSNLSLAKNLAGAHLNYKFGWKPTIGDLSTMIKSVLDFSSRLHEFEQSLGKKIQVSASCDAPSNSINSTLSPGGSNPVFTYSASVKRECKVYITYAPQPLAVMGDIDKTIRGLLDNFGFELNPRIIWEAIPFSFVIDWFLNVGNFLERYKVDALELPIYLVDSCITYKEVLHVEWTGKHTYLGGGYTPIPVSGGARVENTFFHRIPLYPDYATFSGLNWKYPTLNQAALGVSLATVLSK
jgi:hypothetical protein